MFMKHKALIIRAVDFVIWIVSVLLAIWLVRYSVHRRFELNISLALVNAFVTCLVFEIARMYRYVWRYVNFRTIAKGVLCIVASGVIVVIPIILSRVWHIFKIGPGVYKILIVAVVTEIVAWCGSRICYLWLRKMLFTAKTKEIQPNAGSKKNLLIIGGGGAAKLFIEELTTSAISSMYEPVGILDDDATKIGRYIYNVKILGTTSDIKKVCDEKNVESILFAIYNISESKRRAILDECAEMTIPVKMLPHYGSFIRKGKKSLGVVRDVSINDLLGRENQHIDLPTLKKFIEGKTVMVTGGGGSIGGELCRQIIKYNPKLLVILDVYENTAYSVQQRLRRSGYTDFEVVIVSVCDIKQMDDVFAKYRPEIVYHAAAHKHVPLMEDCRIEAIKNNIFGTKNVVDLSDKYGVDKFIMVSTDKAVNPTNVMGATKRACELLVKAKNYRSDTSFVSVRFGNVLGSHGSVIPLFREQIRNGGPVTVTSPECIRFFMTIPEAVELLLTAGSMANGGETFVLDMGEPVKIDDMARKMISLSGYIPDVDIKIKYIGMRPGEKMYEELLVDGDNVEKTCSEKVFVEKPESINLDELDVLISDLFKSADEGNEEEAMKYLKRIVPTYAEN